MRVMLLFRNGLDADFLLSNTSFEHCEVKVVLESGRNAKLKKLKRMFTRASLLKLFFVPFDLVAILIYSNLQIRRMKKCLGPFKRPSDLSYYHCDDVNEPKCISFLIESNPQLIIVYGTSIIGRNFLGKIQVPIFNIHSGIVPQYRNVHSDFWAFTKKDFTNIGISVLYLDAGLDSGDIAFQMKLAKISDHLPRLKVEILKLASIAISKLLIDFQKSTVPRIAQNKEYAKYLATPRLFDLLKYFFS
jgi:methionyl-tRNA formyltransferase